MSRRLINWIGMDAHLRNANRHKYFSLKLGLKPSLPTHTAKVDCDILSVDRAILMEKRDYQKSDKI